MNRRSLLLTTARTAILAITGARAQTPSGSRTVLPVPQARVASPRAPDARNAERTSTYNGKLCQSYAKTGGPYYSSGLAINMFKDALMFGQHDRKDENGYIQDWKGNPDVKTYIFLRNAFPGRYCLRGKGTGQIALWESFYDGHSLLDWTSVGPGTLHAVTGHDDYEWEVYTVASSAIQRDFSTFAIRYSQNYPNHVRALVLMHEAHVQAYDQGRRFDPAAIDKLRAGVGYNRMLDNTSNFTFCASKEEWVPEESFTWHAWVNKNKYAGKAVWATPTHLTVASPPKPFQEKWQEHITVYIPAKTIGTGGSLPTLKVSERQIVGNKTKLVLANPSALPAPEYNVGEHLRFDKPGSVAASMNDQCLNHTEGFHIDDRIDTPNTIELLIDFDTSADPSAAITENVWARPVPWLSIGGRRNIPINNIFFPGWYTAFGDQVRFIICHYDKTRDGWDVESFDGKENPCVVHPSVLVKLCKEMGAHPWFSTPWRAADAYTVGAALPVKENMSDHVREYATVVKNYVDEHAPWMVPIFEPPNETWNPGFPSTQYAYRAAWLRGSSNNNQVSGDADQWYSTVCSLIGQTIAEVFGVQEHQVRTQTKYRFAAGMWTSVNMHEQWSRNANGEVTDFRQAALRIGASTAQVANIGRWKGSWFTDNGGSPAYKWITEIAPATYFNPPIYGTIWEQRMTELWMTDRGTLFDDAIPSSERQQGPYQYLIDFYASKDVNFPPPWDPQKQYHGPRSDGLVDIVTDTDSGGRLFACVALRDSVGVKPSSSWQSGYGGGGQEDPNNHWWRAQGGGRGGNLAQVYENCGYLANNPMFGLIPGTNTTGIGVRAYEGGWSPDTDSTTDINNFRYETQRANTLRYCAYRNYELFHQGSVKYGVIEHKAGWNPSEFSFGGGSIWSVWFTRGPGNFFAHMDPPLPPRWLAMLDWNAQTPPPPPPKEARHLVVSPKQASRHLVVSPKQASPRTPAKVPQSVPSWCHGLNHPNLSVCGPEHNGQ